MSRYFEDAQHLHGSHQACALHCRAWALLHNFRPWHPATARANGGWRSDMTGEAMAEMLKARGFQLVSMFKEWQDGPNSYKAGLYDDLITVFRKGSISV